MALSIIFGLLAFVTGVLFWVSIGLGVYRVAKRNGPAKPFFVRAVVCGLAWCVCICLTVFFVGKAFSSGEIAEAAETSVEVVKGGWNKSLVRKINRLDIQFSSMRRIPRPDEEGYDENDFDFFEMFDFNDKSKSVFEFELLVNNTAAESKKISYRKMAKQKVVYALDKDDVYMNAYIIDDSGVAAIPPILLYFVPSYRAKQASQYIPMGKSRLRIRVDANDAADIKKIFVGEKCIDVSIPPELLPQPEIDEKQ